MGAVRGYIARHRHIAVACAHVPAGVKVAAVVPFFHSQGRGEAVHRRSLAGHIKGGFGLNSQHLHGAVCQALGVGTHIPGHGVVFGPICHACAGICYQRRSAAAVCQIIQRGAAGIAAHALVDVPHRVGLIAPGGAQHGGKAFQAAVLVFALCYGKRPPQFKDLLRVGAVQHGRVHAVQRRRRGRRLGFFGALGGCLFAFFGSAGAAFCCRLAGGGIRLGGFGCGFRLGCRNGIGGRLGLLGRYVVLDLLHLGQFFVNACVGDLAGGITCGLGRFLGVCGALCGVLCVSGRLVCRILCGLLGGLRGCRSGIQALELVCALHRTIIHGGFLHVQHQVAALHHVPGAVAQLHFTGGLAVGGQGILRQDKLGHVLGCAAGVQVNAGAVRLGAAQAGHKTRRDGVVFLVILDRYPQYAHHIVRLLAKYRGCRDAFADIDGYFLEYFKSLSHCLHLLPPPVPP